MREHRVYVDFPKAGLGNLLLVWARARTFSHLNDLPMTTAPWWGFRRGAWWRNERKKRVYWGYFKESSFGSLLKIKVLMNRRKVVVDPPVDVLPLPSKPTLYCFREIAPHPDLFKEIRPYRSFIKQELQTLLKPQLKKRLAEMKSPEIAVHIRRSDFKIKDPITPVGFFVDAVQLIRRTTGRQWPVTIFTDADTEEIEDILHLENVAVAGQNPDILDILSMARARFLVLSQSSTFSYWAAFLSQAIVIKPADDWQNDLRPESVNRERFEGKVDFNEKVSVEKLALALLALKDD